MNNNEVFIIGGGRSLINFDFSKLRYKDTIAVNKSAQFVPGLNYFITMDFTALKKIPSLKNIKATKFFIANFSEPYIKEEEGRIIDIRSGLIYDLKDFDVIIKSKVVDIVSLKFNQFGHGKNSGFCALQLAILLGYKTINLLGIDLKVEEQTHFHDGYGEGIESFQKKLDIYYNNFEKAINTLKKRYPDIKIYSCSKNSRLNNIVEYKKI